MQENAVISLAVMCERESCRISCSEQTDTDIQLAYAENAAEFFGNSEEEPATHIEEPSEFEEIASDM